MAKSNHVTSGKRVVRTTEERVSLDPTIKERFWKHVNKATPPQPKLGPCYLWMKARSRCKEGYGAVRLSNGIKKNATTDQCHRVSWVLAGNSIPAEMCVVHRCPNPHCVRPTHLKLIPESELANWKKQRK